MGRGALICAWHVGQGPVTPARLAGTLSCVWQFGQWKMIGCDELTGGKRRLLAKLREHLLR